MTFDFMVLEGSARRHQIAYRREGEELRRPHWVLGEARSLATAARRLCRILAPGRGQPLGNLEDQGAAGRDGRDLRKMGARRSRHAASHRPDAWHAHLRNMLLRYVTGDDAPARRERLFKAIIDGRFFDAVEWTTFVSKKEPIIQRGKRMKSHPLYLYALDPTHIGAGGYRMGRVDLTILRDAGSNLPKVPGSSINGATRSAAIYSLPDDERQRAMAYARATIDEKNKNHPHKGSEDPVAASSAMPRVTPKANRASAWCPSATPRSSPSRCRRCSDHAG
jgi:hypothetical protein